MRDPSLPERSIQAYEALAALRICVHDISGALRAVLDPSRHMHNSNYCRAIKNGPEQWRCFQFEFTELRADIETLRRRNGRMHRCHAGLIEWVVPVHSDGHVHAILFAGQRRPQFDVAMKQPLSHVKTPAAPVVDETQARHYLEALRQLALRLMQWIQRNAVKSTTAPTRHQKIYTYLSQHHTGAIQLDDLAEYLHVSRSRAAHIVKEETGFSWTELLLQARLRTAQQLLLHSDEAVVRVALLSGFGDQSQFHKVFKRQFGKTPAQFRKGAASIS